MDTYYIYIIHILDVIIVATFTRTWVFVLINIITLTEIVYVTIKKSDFYSSTEIPMLRIHKNYTYRWITGNHPPFISLVNLTSATLRLLNNFGANAGSKDTSFRNQLNQKDALDVPAWCARKESLHPPGTENHLQDKLTLHFVWNLQHSNYCMQTNECSVTRVIFLKLIISPLPRIAPFFLQKEDSLGVPSISAHPARFSVRQSMYSSVVRQLLSSTFYTAYSHFLNHALSSLMTNSQKSALYARKDLICFLLNSLQKNIREGN